MIPIFEKGNMRAALVERQDRPGLLGVVVRGGRFVCPLPEGYDGRTVVAVDAGHVLVGHPYLPALQCDPTTGQVQIIDPEHVDTTVPGRIKLRKH